MADISKIKINDTVCDIKDATARQVMTGATAQENGTSGQVPAPSSSDVTKFLCGNGTWQAVSSGGGSVDTVTMNGTTYSPTSGNINLGTVVTDVSSKADKADTVLDTTLSKGRKANTTVGTGSLAFGNDVTASGNCSVATGLSTKATTSYSHAEGRETIASGTYSHAEGGYTSAQAQYSHAEGNSCIAYEIGSHAEGSHTRTYHEYSHAEGEYTYAAGKASHVSGRYNVMDGTTDYYPEWVSGTLYEIGDKVTHEQSQLICKTANSDTVFDSSKWQEDEYLNFAEIVGMGSGHDARCNARALDWNGNEYLKGTLYVGCNADSTGGIEVATATDVSSKANKADTVLDTTLSRGRATGSTVGVGSFAFGTNVTASGDYTHAEGESCTASGAASHAEGTNTYATGSYAHAEGRQTSSSGVGAHSEGKGANASGNYSHAEGEQTTAYAQSSHVVGRYNVSDSYYYWPTWSAGNSYSVGVKVQRVEDGVRRGYICKTANSDAEFDPTHWDRDTMMNFVEIVGNGTNTNNKCNARAVDWEGNEYLHGDLYVRCDGESREGINISPQIGEIRMTSRAVAPDGWLICDGSVINRETYEDLFLAIGSTYGGGDGETTFAIPNFLGRMPCGSGESTATGHVVHTLGVMNGEETHTLSVAELAAHAHTFSKATATTSGKYKKNAQSGSNTNRVDSSGTSSTSSPYTTTLSLTLNNSGSNTAHNNMPPYTNINFMIYTGVFPIL